MKSEQLISLRRAVEDKFGRPLKTSSDFVALADAMKTKLGVSTLKRIWGYITDHTEISLTSVDILALYAGFRDFDDFLKRSTLNSHEQHVLYSAAKIADKIGAVHSDRFEKAYGLFQRCRYEEAFALFGTEEVQAETQTLCENFTSYTGNIRALISELIIKADLAWCCNWTKEEILKEIAAIYNEALPLSEAINNHYYLWEIYQEWAFKNMQAGNYEQAFDLYEQALLQARIIYIETQEKYVVALSSSLCDTGLLLCENGMYDRAEVVLNEAFQYNSHTFVDLYVRINLGLVCFYTDRKEESVGHYASALKLARKLLKDNPGHKETQFGYGLVLYNLGYLSEESNAAKAKKYYLQAMKIFNKNSETPNVFYSRYRVLCETRLKNL